MLLDGISRDWIVQQEREIGIQIEQGSADECIGFECVAARPVEPIVQRRRAGANTAAVSRIDKAEPVEPSGGHLIQRNLSRREEVVTGAV
jgi:hypothetical protein